MKLSWAFLSVVLLVSVVSSVVGEDQEDFEDESSVEDAQAEEAPQPARERPYYVPPVAKGNTYFTDAFESMSDFKKTWVKSRSKKDGTDESIAKYDGEWSVDEPTDNPLRNDLGLVLKTKAKHHAISASLKKPFEFSGKPFVVQYEVKFQTGQDCGGAYVKLLSKSKDLDLGQFNDKTSYTIMFGPDKCGNDHKLHFIFRHKNPKTGAYEEKHAKKPSASIDSYFSDKKTHLYTLVVKPDNTFDIFVDQRVINSGSLLTDMTPAVNPPKEVTDPNDKKPKDWDEREKIADPDATKPDDWDENEPEMIEDKEAEKPVGWLDDEPELIPDSTSEKPSDWDDDMDGEWEPPMINNPKCESGPGCGEWNRPTAKNPKYKGKWHASMIDNPNYKGKWSAQMIPNPDYFEDNEPYKMTAISAVGLELWSMSDDILFDNFIVTDDRSVADQWAADSWVIKNTEENAGYGASGMMQSVMDATHERPWLWAVMIVVVILPVVLIIAYCCMSSPKVDEAASRKKTDEPAPDVNEDEDVDADAEEDEASSKETVTDNRPKKADLEATSNENESLDTEESPREKDEQQLPAEKRSPRKRNAGSGDKTSLNSEKPSSSSSVTEDAKENE